MKNVVLTGIGGQGTVLAAKVLAQAAQNRGWQVRTAETIGMAQRGGSVVSHVRMGDCGEQVHAPLVSAGQADALIAFEPGEAARVAHLLKPEGVLVSASRVVQPVTASLSKEVYEARPVIEALEARSGRTIIVDEAPLLAAVGNPKALNMVLLATAVQADAIGISLDGLKDAVRACVKPRFVDMNVAAIDEAAAALR
ncbi:MAG: indolepyruvate oxidoreductase subunit beta [Slackia sp.]|nr:indolepyruvate oxidoreductase subunit beta [Slackia sp.]